MSGAIKAAAFPLGGVAAGLSACCPESSVHPDVLYVWHRALTLFLGAVSGAHRLLAGWCSTTVCLLMLLELHALGKVSASYCEDPVSLLMLMLP